MGELDDRAREIADAVWFTVEPKEGGILDKRPHVIVAGICFALAFVAMRYGASLELLIEQLHRCWRIMRDASDGPRVEVVSPRHFDQIVGDLQIPNMPPFAKKN